MNNYIYYTYQYYNPRHPKADDFGYVHSVLGYFIHWLKGTYAKIRKSI